MMNLLGKKLGTLALINTHHVYILALHGFAHSFIDSHNQPHSDRALHCKHVLKHAYTLRRDTVLTRVSATLYSAAKLWWCTKWFSDLKSEIIANCLPYTDSYLDRA